MSSTCLRAGQPRLADQFRSDILLKITAARIGAKNHGVFMPRFQRGASSKTERLYEKRLDELLAAYVDRKAKDGTPERDAHFEATTMVGVMAIAEPEGFWRFMERALGADVDESALGDLGWGPLTELLRHHPDQFIERVEGAAARSPRMRRLVYEISQDRVAPDIWRRLEPFTQAQREELFPSAQHHAGDASAGARPGR